jgi:cation diffusion facilitator CzcD-associated flavoprotein CzcO
MRDIRARYPEILALCRRTPSCYIHSPDPRATLEATPAERAALWEKRYAGPGFGLWQGNFRDTLTDRAANALASEFIANKIRERVHDPVVAERLIPKNHGFGTRRPPLETGYYEVFNQRNVELVDINETPIERVTAGGIRAGRQ